MSTRRDQVNALRRCIESQRCMARQIDEANPGDPYASLMVAEDCELLDHLLRELQSTEPSA